MQYELPRRVISAKPRQGLLGLTDPTHGDASLNAMIVEVTAPSAMDQLDRLRAAGYPILPVKVSRRYGRLVNEEIELLGRQGGPLYNIVYPKHDKFQVRAPGEVVNFVEDFDHMPPGLKRVVVHRYPAKMLYFPTDTCVGHCQYCFRPDVTGTPASLKNRHRNLDPPVIARVVAYLRDHPKVREVIFSGGDPLACKVDDLRRAVEAFMAVPTVRWCRFHTKSPLFAPELVSDALLDLCAEHDIRFVIHAVHPYELADDVAPYLNRIRQRGIMAYNQFPLLRGINDHPAVIMELAYTCAQLGIQMLTMFVADPIRYGAAYRLRLGRVYDIADQVFRQGEGWISNFRVCLDTPIGKVMRQHIRVHDPDRDIYTFQRDGRQVRYQDIPAQMDRPTPVQDLLYRGTRHVDLACVGRDDSLPATCAHH